MKINPIIQLFAFTFAFQLAADAALPLSWTVETTRAQPATFEAYQGETLDFEAALQSRGKPLEAPSNYSFFWQTNGMGSTYWEAPAGPVPASSLAGASTNVLFATWSPSMDVGARVYNCFIGSPSNNYHAAFQLRLRPSPGALPNVLPLPTQVIDFAKVRVLNPPWPGGGSEAETNLVRAVAGPMIAAATNGIRKVDGAAKMLPKYLWQKDFYDSYPEDAEMYYKWRQGSGSVPAPQCSAVRSGGFLYRNFDFPFDDRAEFVVRMSASAKRFASVGVAQVGTNITEEIVTSGKPSRCYKWLPGATVDGINENGVVAEINVVDGDPQTSVWGTTGDLHPLAAVRWILDHATNAQHGAEYIAANIRFPQGLTQNFHYMIADERETWIVENGSAHDVTDGVKVMTNFRLYPTHSTGEGQERYIALANGANITSQWWTLTYTADGYRASDLPGITGESLTQLFNYWENNPRESHRGESFGNNVWWQTVHTSIYDITNRVLRVAVQETDDWYVFQVPSSGAKIDTYTRAETDAKLAGKLDSFGGFGSISWWNSKILEISEGGLLVRQARNDPTEDVRVIAPGGMEHGLSKKADRPSYHDGMAGNLAALTETGDLADSGIGTFNDIAWNSCIDCVVRGLIGYSSDRPQIYPSGSFSGYVGDSFVIVDFFHPVIEPIASIPDIERRISATDTNFSNAVMGVASHTNADFAAEVLAVGLNIDTNAVIALNGILADTNVVAVIGEIAGWPVDPTTGATTIGSLLAALAAAVYFLKRKTSLLESDGKASNTFATNLLGKQVAISAMKYGLASTSATVKAADRTVTKVTLGTTAVEVTFPDADENGKTRDFLLRIDAASISTGGSLTITKPTGATIYGDAFPSPEATKQYLVAITETAANEFYVRTIEITIPTEA